MANTNLAAIDLGTNSCRIMVADCNGNQIYRDSTTTKLGEGMYANMCFTDEAVKRGIKAFTEYSKILKDYNVVKYRAIATAACRMATNGADFVKQVKDLTGIKIEVIDEFEEAYLNLKGAILNADKAAKYVLVYDLGGGSTEITLATNEKTPKILHTVSIPWGARNSAEAFDLSNYNEDNKQKLANEIKSYVEDFIQKSELKKYEKKCSLVATSSTPLRLVAMINNDKVYDRHKSDGQVVSIKSLDKVIEKIYKMSITERENSVYIGKNRAPIIISAGVIFKSIYETLGFENLTASLKGAQDAIITELKNNG